MRILNFKSNQCYESSKVSRVTSVLGVIDVNQEGLQGYGSY